MKLLVAAASRHGSTAEIAARIGAVLERQLRDQHADAVVDVKRIEDVTTVEEYDAAVLGSAVYMGRWLKPAREVVERSAAALNPMPVWLFSSGPLGEPPKPREEATDVGAMVTAVAARDHRTFPGKLDRSRLGLTEKAVVRMVKAPEGDFRDWVAIDAWAASIADALAHERVP